MTTIDLTQSPPTETRLNLGNVEGGSLVTELGWSVHSTELAVIVRDRGYPSPTNLFVLSRGQLRPSGQVVSLMSATRYDRQMVTSFEFQP